MAYDTENIIVGERPYDVLYTIAHSEEGSYGSEIAEKLEIKQQSASEIINRLHDRGLLQKGKRTRAQYYKVDIAGFFSIFEELVSEEIFTEEADYEELLESKKKLYESFQDYTMEEALERDLPVFFNYYIENYLLQVENSTIKKMVFDDFLEGVLMHETGPNKPPGWFYFLKSIAKMKYGFMEDPASMVGVALMEYEQLPDTIEKQHTYLVDLHNSPNLVDIEKTKDGYRCKNCGEEFEEIAVEKESPCGCGVIRTEESMAMKGIAMSAGVELDKNIEEIRSIIAEMPEDELDEAVKKYQTAPVEESIDDEILEEVEQDLQDIKEGETGPHKLSEEIDNMREELVEETLNGVEDVESLSTERLKEILGVLASLNTENTHSKDIDFSVEEYQTFAELEQDVIEELEKRGEAPEKLE